MSVPATQQQNEVEQRSPQQTLVSQIRSPQFLDQVRLALPENVSPERFVRATVTALMQTPELVEAQTESIFNSVIKCAQDGLMPDGREAALVIFNTKVKVDGRDQWVKKAQYMPMIGGFRKIGADHGWSIRTQVVYENDDFEYEPGLDPRIVHRPVRPGQPRGNAICAYAVGAHRDGRREVEVMTAEDIEKVRQVSRSKDSGPWRDWTERMWEKTVGRRLFAKLPLGERETERVRRVVEASYGPGDAAAALYGPEARAALEPPPVAGEIRNGQVHTDTPSPDSADATQGTTDAPGEGGGQQEGEAAAATPTAAPEAAPPSPDDEPEPAPAGQAAFQIPDQVIADAAAYVIGTGNFKGQTVEQVAADEEGERWFSWVLSHPGRVHQDTVAAVETYVRAKLPHLVEGDVQT